MQEIIVFIIVAWAVTLFVGRIFFRKKTTGKDCSSCSGCPLKDTCDKPGKK